MSPLSEQHSIYFEFWQRSTFAVATKIEEHLTHASSLLEFATWSNKFVNITSSLSAESSRSLILTTWGLGSKIPHKVRPLLLVDAHLAALRGRCMLSNFEPSSDSESQTQSQSQTQSGISSGGTGASGNYRVGTHVSSEENSLSPPQALGS